MIPDGGGARFGPIGGFTLFPDVGVPAGSAAAPLGATAVPDTVAPLGVAATPLAAAGEFAGAAVAPPAGVPGAASFLSSHPPSAVASTKIISPRIIAREYCIPFRASTC